jgi:hypothetical protein
MSKGGPTNPDLLKIYTVTIPIDQVVFYRRAGKNCGPPMEKNKEKAIIVIYLQSLICAVEMLNFL